MTRARWLSRAVSVGGAWALTGTGQAAVTTAQLIAQSASVPCLNYCLIGVCFWLQCTPFGCSVETTLRIRHRLPDVVVSAFAQPGQNPWIEARAISQAAANTANTVVAPVLGALGALGGGNAASQRTDPAEHHRLRFKEVDIIGHPLALISGGGYAGGQFGLPYLCPTEATPLKPYYLSSLDALAWRTGATELLHPATFVPGFREIGPWPLQTWGSVYPRHGFLISPEEPKAAAVLAQRAIDIATRRSQLHVYRPIQTRFLPRHVTPPGPSNEKTDAWQMLWPRIDIACHTFGFDPIYAHGRLSATGDYAWQFWQTYSCCIPKRGAVYLFSIETVAICPFGG